MRSMTLKLFTRVPPPAYRAPSKILYTSSASICHTSAAVLAQPAGIDDQRPVDVLGEVLHGRGQNEHIRNDRHCEFVQLLILYVDPRRWWTQRVVTALLEEVVGKPTEPIAALPAGDFYEGER